VPIIVVNTVVQYDSTPLACSLMGPFADEDEAKRFIGEASGRLGLPAPEGAISLWTFGEISNTDLRHLVEETSRRTGQPIPDLDRMFGPSEKPRAQPSSWGELREYIVGQDSPP
jgi:hypothetical protein